MTKPDSLTRNQMKAISALLACQTIAEAANVAGLSERTLYRWMNDGDFSGALRAAAYESVGDAVRRLVAGRDEALDTLYNLMLFARSENVKRLAAKDWLDVLHRTTELEVIERRLADLEAAIYGQSKN